MCICESNGRVLIIFPVILPTVINVRMSECCLIEDRAHWRVRWWTKWRRCRQEVYFTDRTVYIWLDSV